MRHRTLALVALLLVAVGALIGRNDLGDRDREATRSVATAPATAAPAPPVERDAHPRIDDAAGILAPFAPRLGRMADDFREDLGIDLHVVTSNDATDDIDRQAVRLFEARGIGADAPTGGLLVVLNPAVKAARIEVGYSLEHALTDLHMGRIARDQLAPYAAYGAGGMAVMDVLHYLRDQVYLAAARDELALAENFRRKPAYLEMQRFASGGAGARTALSDVALDADLKQRIPDERRARYAPSSDPLQSVQAFLRGTAELAGDPSLELYTEGSRLMRAAYPVARFEELQRYERLNASMPLEIVQQGDYAVASSAKPAKGFVPVLLRREQGVWRVDLVETWKNLFFDADGNYFLRNSNTPYAFGLARFGKGQYYDIAALPLGGASIATTLEELSGRPDVLSELRSAELWLRNAFVFPRAYQAYAAALKAAPRDPLVLETVARRTLYLGFPEIAIPLLEQIGTGVELTLAGAYSDTGDLAGARRCVDRALAENPYDYRALRWAVILAEREGRTADLKKATEAVAAAEEHPGGAAYPVDLYFHPQDPEFEPHGTLDVGGTRVFDHSRFGVTMRNPSNRTIEIESVTLKSYGTARASGLGDVRGYWQFPAGANRLRPGEAVYFDKQWGFTVDTGHEHVRYVFRTCWRGEDTKVRQCRTQWVDVLPRADS